MSLPRRLVAEGLGTAFLLAVVIGSGIMGERLAGGNMAMALLANSLATGGGLVVLILYHLGVLDAVIIMEMLPSMRSGSPGVQVTRMSRASRACRLRGMSRVATCSLACRQ